MKGAAARDRLPVPQTSANEQQQNVSLFWKMGTLSSPAHIDTVKIGRNKLLSWSAEQGLDLQSEGVQGLMGWRINLLILFSGFQLGFS